MTRALSKIEQLSYQKVKQISEDYQLDRAAIRCILGISESTQFRYEKKNPILKPNLGDRWLRFEDILKQANELFTSKTETQRWLSTPKAALENQTPLEILGTNAGVRQVEQMLNRAKYGIFS